MTGRPERDQIWDYPLEALRETLINAVCHRDTIISNIEVRIYDDKLVIRSPGFLPYGITLEELYKPHSSTLRNKGLSEEQKLQLLKNYIETNGKVTNEEARNVCGVTRYQAVRLIQKFVQEGTIIQKGQGRGAYYEKY